jgi:hypothetical protein
MIYYVVDYLWSQIYIYYPISCYPLICYLFFNNLDHCREICPSNFTSRADET